MAGLCIIGCGAMGTLLAHAYYRAEARPPVCVLRPGGGLSEVRRRGGVILEGAPWPPGPAPVVAVEPGSPVLRGCRWTVVAVKAWSVPEALRHAPEGPVWLLVNGLGQEGEMLRRGLRPRFIVSTYGATRLGPGRAELRGEGLMLVGGLHGLDRESCLLASALRAGGLRAYCTGEIQRYRVEKAVVNAIINTITGLLGAPNRVVLETGPWRAAEAMARELAAAARALGVPMGPGRVLTLARSVAGATADNISSTLQDLRSCRRTEAPWILGPLERAAREAGVEPRALAALWGLLDWVEGSGLHCRKLSDPYISRGPSRSPPGGAAWLEGEEGDGSAPR